MSCFSFFIEDVDFKKLLDVNSVRDETSRISMMFSAKELCHVFQICDKKSYRVLLPENLVHHLLQILLQFHWFLFHSEFQSMDLRKKLRNSLLEMKLHWQLQHLDSQLDLMLTKMTDSSIGNLLLVSMMEMKELEVFVTLMTMKKEAKMSD